MKEWRDIHFALALVAAFFVSRLMFFASGIRFFSDSLMYYIQFIDADLLRHDLLRSVFYFHYQPPLFNLILGTVLKVLPGHYGVFFGLVYWVMGLAMLLGLYFLMRAMNVPKALSAALAGVFSISPSCAAYENTLFYTYPITLLLCLAALALYGYLSTKKVLFAAVFFSMLAAVILMGSMFHMIWFLFAFGPVMVRDKAAWRRLVLAAAVPFLLISAVYIKNFAVFGFFGTSSLAGFQLAMMTSDIMPVDKKLKLMDEGKLSIFSIVNTLGRSDDFEIFTPPSSTGKPVLDRPTKTERIYNKVLKKNEPGYNMNHSSYLYASDRYLADAIYVLSHYPGYYLEGVRQALFAYFIPGPLKDHGEGANYRFMRMISPFETLYNKLLLWQFMPRVKNLTFYFDNKNFETGSSLFWIMFFPFLMTWAGIEIAGGIRRREFRETSFIMALFMWGTAMYVTLISVFFGTWMGPGRYRFYIEPFFVCLVGMYLPGVVTKIAEKVKREGTLILNNMAPGSMSKAAVLSAGTFGIFFIFLVSGGSGYPLNRPLPSEEEIGVAPVYNAMGKFFMERNDASRAVKYFEKAETSDPGSPAAALNLEKARDMDGGGETYVTGATEHKLLIVLGTYQYLKGSLRLAEALFEDAVALEPRDLKTLYYLGRMYIRTGDYKKAEERLKKAEELSPGNPSVLKKLKEISEGKLDMVKSLNKKGAAVIRSKDFDKAISIFEKALELDPGSSRTFNNLGYAYYLSGDKEKALKYIGEALKIDPNNEKARKNLDYINNPPPAKAPEQTGDGVADPDAGAVWTVDGGVGEAGKEGKVKALNKQGAQAVKEKDVDRAISLFEKALEADPQSARTCNNLGYAWFLKGDGGKAVKYLEQAVKLAPGHAKAKKNLEYVRKKIAERSGAAPFETPAEAPADGAGTGDGDTAPGDE